MTSVLRPGQEAPDFELTDASGRKWSLRSLRGRPVLLNFWATWCGPCRNEMPAIQNAYDTYKAEGFEVWGVNVAETPDQVQAYMKQLGLNFDMVLDSDSKVSHQYHVFGLPTSVFLGRDGVIREVIVGEMAENSLDANLKKLVRQ
jgi:peroxiredoxin